MNVLCGCCEAGGVVVVVVALAVVAATGVLMICGQLLGICSHFVHIWHAALYIPVPCVGVLPVFFLYMSRHACTACPTAQHLVHIGLLCGFCSSLCHCIPSLVLLT